MKRPMKGFALEDKHLPLLKFPLIGFAKYNGWRAVWERGIGLRTKSMKRFANNYIHETYMHKFDYTEFDMLDSELMTGPNASKGLGTANECKKAFSRQLGTPNTAQFVFDGFLRGQKGEKYYIDRLEALQDFDNLPVISIYVAPYVILNNLDDLLRFETDMIKAGFEGIMLRSGGAPYKEGVSTLNEGYMFKLKRFADDEAIIIGYEPMYKNLNMAEEKEDGYSKRTSHQEGKIPMPLLGAWIVQNEMGVFNVGGGKGVTLEQRAEWWEIRDSMKGSIITFKYLPHGMKDVPSGAQFVGVRDSRDMDADDPLLNLL